MLDVSLGMDSNVDFNKIGSLGMAKGALLALIELPRLIVDVQQD